MMRRILVVLGKELVDNLRDRRSVSAALLFTLLGPIVMATMLALVGRVTREKGDEVIVLPTIGVERAPGLVEQLERQRIRAVATELDVAGLREAVRTGDHDVALIIDETYPEEFRAGRPAPVQIVLDPSRSSPRPAVERVRRTVASHGLTVGRLRLLARGIDPGIADAIALDTVDVSTPQSMAAMLFGMLPFFLIMAIFLGGYYLVVDSTAGELERGSLEPLMVNPVARRELLVGKLGAGICFSAVGLGVAAFGFWLVPQLIRFEAVGSFRLDARVMLRVVVVLLPMVLFATAAGMVIATLCRSFKLAQTMLSLVMLLPIAPGLLLTVAPFKTQIWMFCVPILSEQILVQGLTRGDRFEPHAFALSAASTLAAFVAAMLLATRLFTGERLFGARRGGGALRAANEP